MFVMPKGVMIGVLVAALGINCEETPAGVWFTDVAAKRELVCIIHHGRSEIDWRGSGQIWSTGTGALVAYDYDGDIQDGIFIISGAAFNKAEAPRIARNCIGTSSRGTTLKSAKGGG